MLSTRYLSIALTILPLVSGTASAIPFGFYETRSMGMGGVGVAMAEAEAAPLYNPALLSVPKDEDNFFLILPSISARVNDPDGLIKSVDSFQNGNYVNTLQTSISNLQTAINTVNSATPATINAAIADVGVKAGTVTTDLNTLSTELGTMSNKPINGEAGATFVLAMPSRKHGFALYANGTAAVGGMFLYKDAPLLATLATQTQCLATAAAMPTSTPAETAAATAAVQACAVPNFSSAQLNSGINFRGVALGEVGFSVSRVFYIHNRSVAFGITPKYVKAQLYDAPISVNSSNQSNITAGDYLAEYSYLNLDVGVAKYIRRGWRVGMVVKNVIPQTLAFKNAPTPGATPVANGNYLYLRPQVRAGFSHSNDWAAFAMDLDLTRNDPAGLEHETQYLSLGGELSAWRTAQIRAGFRADLINSSRNLASLGLGFSPLGVRADVAVAGNANEIGVSLQVGFRY